MFRRIAGAVSTGLLSAALAPASAEARTPALIWNDVSKIGIQCLVHPTIPANTALQADLCDRIRTLASQGAPAPVAIIQPGDPALLAAGTVTLLVHVSVQPFEGRRLVAFTVRPFRVSEDQNSVLFGAMPRAVAMPAAGTTSPALDAAITAALSETLPWLAQPQGPRRITSRR